MEDFRDDTMGGLAGLDDPCQRGAHPLTQGIGTIRQNNIDEIGTTLEVLGHGYQQGEFNGLELLVKDSKCFLGMPRWMDVLLLRPSQATLCQTGQCLPGGNL